MEKLSGTPLEGRLLALGSNIRPGVDLTNYFDVNLLTLLKARSFHSTDKFC